MTIKQSSKAIGIAAAVLFATASVHAQPAADNFTFTTKSGEPTIVGGNASAGNDYTGMHLDGTFENIRSTGQKTRGTFTCVAMTQPPNGKLFDMHMLCDATDNTGKYSVTMGCTIIDIATGHYSCIGGLYGKSGAYAGRRGTLTNYSLNGQATGTGQWYR